VVIQIKNKISKNIKILKLSFPDTENYKMEDIKRECQVNLVLK
jgi:hypothetical protein